MNNITSNVLRFVVLLVVQIAVCQHVCLFGYMSPSIYLLALLLLPLELPLSLQYFIGFVSGFVVDAFAHTLGVCSFAATLMMFVRPYVANFLNGSSETKFEAIDKPLPGVKDFRWIFLYTLTLVLVYQISAIMLETMSFRNFWHTLLVIVGNTIFSVFVILCTEYVFHPIVKK